MASKQLENQSLDLDQLIGGPLMSLVQAETHAAKATVGFIETIGFIKPQKPATGDTAATSEPASDTTGKKEDETDNLGELRTVTFKYNKNIQGVLKRYEVRIPVLSLIPIPLLQIDKVELEFSVRIAEFVSRNDQNIPLADSFLQSKPMAMKATIASGSKTTGSSLQKEMRVKMNLKQSDLPSGFAKLVNMMDYGISETQST